jgi:hypothetical protein
VQSLTKLNAPVIALVGQVLMVGCAFSIETSQIVDLKKLPNANASLSNALECFHGKAYPDDVDPCGIAVFGSERQLNEVEACLRIYKSRSLKLLVENRTWLGLAVDCKSGRVFILFKKLKGDILLTMLAF